MLQLPDTVQLMTALVLAETHASEVSISNSRCADAHTSSQECVCSADSGLPPAAMPKILLMLLPLMLLLRRERRFHLNYFQLPPRYFLFETLLLLLLLLLGMPLLLLGLGLAQRSLQKSGNSCLLCKLLSQATLRASRDQPRQPRRTQKALRAVESIQAWKHRPHVQVTHLQVKRLEHWSVGGKAPSQRRAAAAVRPRHAAGKAARKTGGKPAGGIAAGPQRAIRRRKGAGPQPRPGSQDRRVPARV